MSKAILYDATLCIDCKQCEGACAKQNGLPYDDKIAAESVQSAHKFTVVLANNDNKFMRRLCMHCNEPACASVCPVGALHKTKEGPVVYDVYKCIGCRYCMVACAFSQPKYEWGKLNPARAQVHHVSRPGADRAAYRLRRDLPRRAPPSLAIAMRWLPRRKDRLRQNPDNYYPHIYGLNEVGGTSVLILSSVPVESFGLPSPAKLGTTPMPDYTFRILSKIPDFVPLWALVLGGVYWITHRREEVALAEASEHGSEQGGTK